MKQSLFRSTPEFSPQIVLTYKVLLSFLGILFLWSLIASLDSAAIAPGTIAVVSHLKQVQHPEGGRIREVLVKEGDVVRKGDLLVVLDTTQSLAALKLLQEKQLILTLRKSRLEAAQRRENTLSMPSDLSLFERDAQLLQNLLQNERQLLKAQVHAHQSEIDMLQRQAVQVEEQKAQVMAEFRATQKQKELIEEELSAVKELAEQKLVRKPRLLALQREEAKLEANIFRLSSETKRLKERKAEVLSRLEGTIGKFDEALFSSLDETNQELLDTQQRLVSAQHIHLQKKIFASEDGVVQGLKYHTKGEVIQPAESIMSIVPVQDELIVQVQINPLDIDTVHKGLKAKVQLSSFSVRETPTIWGTVEFVSPDIFRDSNLGINYYSARVRLNPKELGSLNKEIVAGMPVEVQIIGDRASPFSYLLAPLFRSFDRAFREP